MKRQRRAQSTVEYVVLITLLLAALLTMSVYFRRGLQGKWKASVDEVGEQYDPWAMNGYITYRTGGETETRIMTVPAGEGVWTTRVDLTNAIDTKQGQMRVASP